MQDLVTNFSLILFILMVVTGIIWSLDVFYLAKQRRARADAALAEYDARNARLSSQGVKVDNTGRAELEQSILRQPTWIEYSGSFFQIGRASCRERRLIWVFSCTLKARSTSCNCDR